MEDKTELQISYDNLVRRVKLLEVKAGEPSVNPVSLRLTKTEAGIVNNMCEIFGLNKSTIIKLCIRGAAEHLAEEQRILRLDKLLGVG